MTPAMLSKQKSPSWVLKEASLPGTARFFQKGRAENVPRPEGANEPATKHGDVGAGKGQRGGREPPSKVPEGWGRGQRAYLRGHAAALAVALGDELVEEQVDLGAAGAAVIRAQGAEPG